MKGYAGVFRSKWMTEMDSLLVEMVSGKRLVFQIGNTEGSIPLDGFADAFANYERRVVPYK